MASFFYYATPLYEPFTADRAANGLIVAKYKDW
jgi:hypothetical protein